MIKPKFNVGDEVYNRVSAKGTYEPSICYPFTSLTVSEVKQSGSGFVYICGYDGYRFREEELISKSAYMLCTVAIDD